MLTSTDTAQSVSSCGCILLSRLDDFGWCYKMIHEHTTLCYGNVHTSIPFSCINTNFCICGRFADYIHCQRGHQQVNKTHIGYTGWCCRAAAFVGHVHKADGTAGVLLYSNQAGDCIDMVQGWKDQSTINGNMHWHRLFQGVFEIRLSTLSARMPLPSPTKCSKCQ